MTGRDVPDETKRVPLLTYVNPRPAEWPPADYIVGNPPFLGTARMREDLGDGYAETLRATYPAVPESADFVMYWWHKAAELVRAGKAKRFGFITTNSLRQTFAAAWSRLSLQRKPAALARLCHSRPPVGGHQRGCGRSHRHDGWRGGEPRGQICWRSRTRSRKRTAHRKVTFLARGWADSV